MVAISKIPIEKFKELGITRSYAKTLVSANKIDARKETEASLLGKLGKISKRRGREITLRKLEKVAKKLDVGLIRGKKKLKQLNKQVVQMQERNKNRITVVHRRLAHMIKGFARAYKIVPNIETHHFEEVLRKAEPKAIKILNADLLANHSIKIRAIASVRYRRYNNALGDFEYWGKTGPIFHDSGILKIYRADEVAKKVKFMFSDLLQRVEEAELRGSGWSLYKVFGIDLYSAKYDPFSGRSYMELPEDLQNKKGLINIKNEDNKCFMWCILAAIHPVKKDPQRVTKYLDFQDELKFDGIEFPFEATDENVKKFSEMNDISVNIFTWDKKLIPLVVLGEEKDKHIDLLLIGDLVGDQAQNHYVWIKDFDRFRGKDGYHKHHCCKKCLVDFTPESFKQHQEIGCSPDGPCVTVMPKEEECILEFKNYKNQLEMPYVIYADFESLLLKRNKNNKVQKHKACSWGYVLVSRVPGEKPIYRSFRGKKCVDKFLETIMEDAQTCLMKIQDNKEMEFEGHEVEFSGATDCHICGGAFIKNDPKGHKVRDHDHLTGKYRGASHNVCNLNYNLKFMRIPVFCHNMKNYDAHLICSKLGAHTNSLSAINQTADKYVYFQTQTLKFVDSIGFLNESLARLVDNLEPNQFRVLKEFYGDLPKEKFELLTQKGVLPYSYLDSRKKFDDQEYPKIEEFYDLLKKKTVDLVTWQRGKIIWDSFECKNMGEYLDLYMKSDVLLLADVFENFRDVCLKVYILDPCHYLTAPGLFWDAMLKHTGVKMELLTDCDIYAFIEKGVRGGMSIIPKRYARANNYLMKDYDDKIEDSWIVPYDANNLYGWAMSQYLPLNNFKWCKNLSVFTKQNILAMEDDRETGYILEVDLKYPQELHDLHNDYPLAPEKRVISEEELSEKSKQLKKLVGLKDRPTEKLITSLYDKENYVVHYRTLRLYLELGMELMKVHRVVSFTQKDWMRPYIEFNTEKRKEAQNDFEKDFYKLANNAVYGKTLEDVRKHKEPDKFITGDDYKAQRRYLKLVANPRYAGEEIFNKHLVGVHMTKKEVRLNKPIAVGMSVLDISKFHMYNFHYNVMKKKYGERISLILSDTDSLYYHIKTKNIYADLKGDDHFDFSNLQKDNVCFSGTNKKRVGCFKDESFGVPIKEIVCLRAKMYATKLADSAVLDSLSEEYRKDNGIKNKKIAKGVPKHIRDDEIDFQDYYDCLEANTVDKALLRHNFNQIRSKKHKLNTIKITKKTLCSFDDKFYILDDGINTLSYGNYKISYD